MRSEGHVTRRKERKVPIGYWWENLKVMRLLGRYRRRCEDNLQMGLRKVDWKAYLDSSGSRKTDVA